MIRNDIVMAPPREAGNEMSNRQQVFGDACEDLLGVVQTKKSAIHSSGLEYEEVCHLLDRGDVKKTETVHEKLFDGEKIRWSQLSSRDSLEGIEYPLDALGPILGEAANVLARDVVAPPEVAAHSVLGVASFASQGIADVAMDSLQYPCSAFLLVVAESGARKSTCDALAQKPLDDYQRRLNAEYKEATRLYEIGLGVHKRSQSELIRSTDLTDEQKKQKIASLSKPRKPVSPLVVSQEPTLEGLQKSIAQGRRSQAIFSDEAGQFFGGYGMSSENRMKTSCGLSKMWDGGPFHRTRAMEGESLSVRKVRLTVQLQAQPYVARSVLGDELMAKQGVLGRFLVAHSACMIGTRQYQSVDVTSDPAVSAYWERINQILENDLTVDSDGELVLDKLWLDDEAKRQWISRYNEVERAQGKGLILQNLKSIASKSGEHAMRLAGIFAVVEKTSLVTADQVIRAWRLVNYYLASSVLASRRAVQDEVENKEEQWLKWLKKLSSEQLNIKYLSKSAPRQYRNGVDYIRTLMQHQEDLGHVRLIEKDTKGQPCEWALEK